MHLAFLLLTNIWNFKILPCRFFPYRFLPLEVLEPIQK